MLKYVNNPPETIWQVVTAETQCERFACLTPSCWRYIQDTAEESCDGFIVTELKGRKKTQFLAYYCFLAARATKTIEEDWISGRYLILDAQY